MLYKTKSAIQLYGALVGLEGSNNWSYKETLGGGRAGQVGRLWSLDHQHIRHSLHIGEPFTPEALL